MNILFFTYDFPYPTNSGGKTRAYNLLKFAKKDNTISLFSFTRSNFSISNKKGLEEIGIHDMNLFPRRHVVDIRNIRSFLTNRSIFHSLYFDHATEKRLFDVVKEKKIDIFHAESFYTAFYLSQRLRDLGVKQIYGTENIEYKIYEEFGEQTPSLLKKVFFQDQARKIKREEKGFYDFADTILAVTPGEAKEIEKVSGKKCEVIENGVDFDSFAKQFPTTRPKNTLVFLGNFTYFPNLDALTLFMRQIFPLLPEECRVVVIGKKSSTLTILQHPRVETVEYVDDIQEAYNRGTIFISPVRFGGGTNFKILEAIAAGVPVVALSERVKGLGFRDGKELLLADTSEEFAKKVTLLLRDESLQRKLIENAHDAVRQRYNWKTIGEKLNSVWRKTIDAKY